MSRNDFYDLTPRAFFNKLSGFYEYERFLQEQAWRRTRQQTVDLINNAIALSGQKLRIDPKDLYLLGDEKPAESKEMSMEEADKIFEKWDKNPVKTGVKDG